MVRLKIILSYYEIENIISSIDTLIISSMCAPLFLNIRFWIDNKINVRNRRLIPMIALICSKIFKNTLCHIELMI